MTSEQLAPLETLLAAAPRGPSRDGLFAVWVTARATLDLQRGIFISGRIAYGPCFRSREF